MKAGKSSSAGTRKSTGLLPQIICTTSSIDERKPEGEQQLGDMAVLVHAAQAVAFDAAPIAPTSNGAINSAGQKPNHRLI